VTTGLVLLSRVAFRNQEITSPRLRALLALLATDLRAGCSSARLVDGLWPDEQPENPTKALQVLVSRARAQLGSDVIASTPTGYRLALVEDEVDASAVLLSAAASVRHARAGDHLAALRHAEAGLALWEGAPVGDTGPGDPLSALRADRAVTGRSLLRARALALSRLGRRAEALDGLTEAAREQPRDEEVLLELLRCEAATMGPAAALARYESYRRSLRDQLGADPGADLQALHQQLLRDATPAVRHGVLHDPNPLLGREDDIAAVLALLRTSRVTSIVGAGGLGKTRLAHVVSRDAEQRVVHFVPLAGVATDGDVAGEVASVLDVREPRGVPGASRGIPPDILTGLAVALGPGPVLLVLDNCEHVVRGAAELVGALVSMTGDLRVLTTGRAPLGLSSESVYLLPELDLPTSVELFGQRARAARPGVDLPADVVTELCRHLDGLPLAVELAAARVRAMSVAEIARRLADRFALLRGGARDAPERHRTLLAVVEWSWNLLAPAGQAAMRALSVFPGGFTADAARRLLGDGDVPDLLEDLVGQSLLKVQETAAGTRFRMLETVRDFSTARREEAGETDRVTDAFLGWARDFGVANHESLLGSDPIASARRVRADVDNLLLALRLGVARADGATVAAASAVLAGLWMLEANYSRLISLIEESDWVLSHFRPEPDFVSVTRMASTLFAANTFSIQGPRAVRSLVVLRRLPPEPPSTLLGALRTLLLSGAPGPDHATLPELYDSDEPLVAAIAAVVTSYAAENAGDPDGALKAALRGLDAVEGRATPWVRMLAHARVSELCMQAERGVEAQRHMMAALRLLEELGPWPDVIGIKWTLALAALHRGAVDEAERWLSAAAAQEGVGDQYGLLSFQLGVRAEIQLVRGDVETGLRLWRRAADQLSGSDDQTFRIPSTGLDPWAMEVQSVAVAAHAQHGRLDLVEDILGDLSRNLWTMLTSPVERPPPFFMEQAVCGALLLALGLADLDRGRRTGDGPVTRTAVHMIALAERLQYLRGFQPTMSRARARRAAEQADRSAYDDAVSSYADLGREELRAAAMAVLRRR
jgi:predicted ATPase/DNA-binding SARP family transcriptional activator